MYGAILFNQVFIILTLIFLNYVFNQILIFRIFKFT